MTKNTLFLIPVLTVIAVQMTACGRGDSSDGSSDDGSGISVNGAEGFSTQCPSGTIEPVTPITNMQLYNCPIGVDTLQLTQPLEPIYLQADCQKKTITARTLDKRIESAWETMPNNSFYFTLGMGTDGQDNRLRASLASDGSGGHSNCTTPLTVAIDGSMDCTNPDKPIIHFETTMWPHLKPNPVQSSRPVPIVTPGPTATGPVEPSGTPTPVASGGPIHFPWPFPSATTTPDPHHTHHLLSVTGMPAAATTNANQCNLPESCYIYTQQMSLTQCP
jgi:hypothetical protein